jgi:serine/threonine protein kinase
MENFNFQNYKILNLIGEGSFGKVFKAAENNTKNVVALKILIKVSEFDEFLAAFNERYIFFRGEDRRKNFQL